MPDIWEQFHQLPKAIRDAVATPGALAAIDRLERQYPGLDLASLVMRAMVKEFPLSDLGVKLQNENTLDQLDAKTVADTLRREVFSQVGEYIGVDEPSPAPPPAVKPGLRPMSVDLGVMPIASPPAPAPKITPPPANLPATPPPVPVASVAPMPVIPPVATAPAKPIGDVAPTAAYSDEDAVEISQQSQRLRSLSASSGLPDFDQTARAIIEAHQLGFHDDLLLKRAVAIFKARLKDIRPSAVTKDMMTKSPKVGGLGLDPDVAGHVVASLEAKAAELKAKGMVRTPVPIAPPPPPVRPPVDPQKQQPLPPLQRVLPESGPMMEVPVTPTAAPTMPSRPIKRPADIPAPSTEMPVAAPAPKTIRVQAAAEPTMNIPASQPMVQRARLSDRPSIADITAAPRVALGPAEEMQSLTLAEFRRLGQGAGDAARRLFEKFEQLKHESFTLHAAAVKGWRESEVFSLYVQMGRESLEAQAPITEIIKKRGQSGLPYLSEHEFNVVADLNRQLHY